MACLSVPWLTLGLFLHMWLGSEETVLQYRKNKEEYAEAQSRWQDKVSYEPVIGWKKFIFYFSVHCRHGQGWWSLKDYHFLTRDDLPFKYYPCDPYELPTVYQEKGAVEMVVYVNPGYEDWFRGKYCQDREDHDPQYGYDMGGLNEMWMGGSMCCKNTKGYINVRDQGVYVGQSIAAN